MIGPRPAMAVLVTAVRAVTLVVVVSVLAIALAAGTVERQHHRPVTNNEAPISSESNRVQRLMTLHRCSTTGFGKEHIPGSALVRRAGKVRHVSFDHGWAVFSGERAGTLVAVCLDDR